MFRHMIWADRQVWNFLRNFPKSAEHKEIKEKLCHIHEAPLAFYQIWMERPVEIPGVSSFYSLHDILEWAEENHKKILQYVEQIDPAKLDEEVKLPWAKNVQKSLSIDPQPCTLLQSMQQVFQHSAYHRGQINGLIRRLGEDPPLTDFILWVLKGKP